MTPEWLMVIITAVYVIATIFICYFNAKSATEARKQTEQMNLQFRMSTRPIISVEIVYLKRAYWALRFINRGAETAFNMTISLNQDFINALPEKDFQQRVVKETEKVRTIGVNQHYDLFFGGKQIRTSENMPPLRGRMNYSGIRDTIFVEYFEIELQNYATFYSVTSELEDIKIALEAQTKEIAKIKQSIDNINGTMDEAEEGPSLAEYLGAANTCEEQ